MLDLLPDLCDQYADRLTVLPPIFQSYGGKSIFHGQLVTIRCPEDNGLARELLSLPGQGKVLAIDGGGMSRRALLGDNLAQMAADNGWNGIVVFGYVRDAATLATIDIGVQALGVTPMKTDKRGLGERNVVIEVQGCRVNPNEYIYADLNGIVVAKAELELP